MDSAQSHEFGVLLRRYRLAAGLTQEALAEQAGLSARGVRALEQGEKHAPQKETIARLVKALHLSAEDRAAWEAAIRHERVLHPAARAAEPVPLSLHRPQPLVSPPPLPALFTPLLGREREVATAGALVMREDVRLVTLTGPGGVGKTSLGLAVIHAVRDLFPDGAVYVDLSIIRAPDLVLVTIAQALGLREENGQSPHETLTAALRVTRLLLVLDNFEQVVPAAPAISRLCTACPRLKVVVTSRVPLHLRGERVVPVPPLVTPDPDQGCDAASVQPYASVDLFVRHAQEVSPGFALTDANAGAVAAICRRLDGLPLAIELAATRVTVLPPSALLARLSSRLPMLMGRVCDLPDRQQTMRAAIAWSYDLLTPTDQALFFRLAVFAGGCTIEAAEALCAAAGDTAGDCGTAVLEGLVSLVDQSLLRQEEQADGEPRFKMLEMVREYGLERLSGTGAEEAVRRQHATYFLALAETAQPELGGPGQASWLVRLEAEHDNLRAALSWALQHGDAAMALRLGVALWRFWHVHGHLTEGRRWLDEALALVGTDGSLAPARAQALSGAGMLAYHQGAYARATSLLEESRALYEELGDRGGVATTLNNQGHVAADEAAYERAAALYEEGLAVRRASADKAGIAASLNNLGTVARHRGDYERAEALLGESLAIKRSLNDDHGIAVTLNNLGLLARDQRCCEQAQALYAESLALFRRLDGRRGVAYVLNNLGVLACDRDEYAEATRLSGESLALCQRMGDTWAMTFALTNLGSAACMQGHDMHAATLYAESLALLRRIGAKSGLAECLVGVAGLLGLWGEHQQAVLVCSAAAALRTSLGAPLPPADRTGYDRALGEARVAVDAVRFHAAWTRGRMMPRGEVIAVALQRLRAGLLAGTRV